MQATGKYISIRPENTDALPEVRRGSLSGFPTLVQMSFHQGDNLSEGFRIMHSHIGQYFTIQGNLRPF